MNRILVGATISIASIMLMVGASPALAQAAPGNDRIEDSLPIQALPFSETVDIAGATVDDREGPGDCERVANSVWYRFEPTANVGLTVTIDPGVPQTDERFRPVIGLYRGASATDLEPLACLASGRDNEPVSTVVLAEAGAVYHIKMASSSRRGYTPGRFTLTVQEQQPVNDFFATATEITVPFVDRDVNIGSATNETRDERFADCGRLYSSTWYAFRPENDVVVGLIATPEASGDDAFNVVLAAYEGSSLDGLTPMACANESRRAEPEVLALKATGGKEYRIQVGSNSQGRPGVFTLEVQPQLPVNDFFTDATTVQSLPYTEEAVDTRTATEEEGEGTADCRDISHTAWYAIHPDTQTTVRIRVDPGAPTTEERFYPFIAIWRGDAITDLSLEACISAPDRDQPVVVAVPLTAGEDYRIQVGTVKNYDPAVFSVTIQEQDPANDFFVAAREVTLPLVDAAIDGASATSEGDERLGDCDGRRYASVWYRHVAADDGELEILAEPGPAGDMDLVIAAFEGESLDALTEVGCGNEGRRGESERLTIPMQAGSIYRIQVGVRDPQAAGPFSVTFPADQSITFGPLPGQVFGAPPFEVSAIASSGLPVEFRGDGACIVTGSTVTITQSGTCRVTASQQGGEGGWRPAPVVTQVLEVDQATQTITFAPMGDATFGDPPIALTATATSGLPVTFTGEGACTVDAALVAIVGAGTCTVTATQEGDSGWAPAPEVTVTFAVAPAGQTITFRPLPDLVYTLDPILLEATASSGLPVAYSAAGVCSVEGDQLFVIAPGECTVTASQPGDGGWAAATDVSVSFAISAAEQTITFAPLPDVSWSDASFDLIATATSGLPVVLSATGSCAIYDSTLTLVSAGSCTITASQAGDIGWSPAPDVVVTFTVSPAEQAIDFAPIEPPLLGAPAVDLVVSASSGLAVTLTADGGCSVDGTTLSVSEAGACTLTASQAGDERWAPAAPVTQAFEVPGPVEGEADLTGTVATEIPGTLVAPGAKVRSLLDPRRRPVEYFSVPLEAGEQLTVTVVADGHAPSIEIAHPDALAAGPAGVDAIAWEPLPATGWLATEPGIHTVRIRDDAGSGSAYRYTIAFDATDLAGPPTDLPADGSPVTGEANLVGKVADGLPGTLVGPGAVVTSMVGGERRPAEYFGIELAIGDTLDLLADGVQMRIAYPDALTSGVGAADVEWVPVDGTWLASEAGIYSVEVSSGTATPALYRISFGVNLPPPSPPPAPVATVAPSPSAIPLDDPSSSDDGSDEASIVGYWQLIEDASGPLSDDVALELGIDPDGSVYGNGVCSSISGTWEEYFYGTQLVLEAEMDSSCGPDEQEWEGRALRAIEDSLFAVTEEGYLRGETAYGAKLLLLFARLE